LYDPYGNVTVLDADFSPDADGVSDYANPVLYGGYWRDAETYLYHVRYRYYHPRLGCWITRDLGEAYRDGMNSYEYVKGCPTGFPDSSGLVSSDAAYTQCVRNVLEAYESCKEPAAIAAIIVGGIEGWPLGATAYALYIEACRLDKDNGLRYCNDMRDWMDNGCPKGKRPKSPYLGDPWVSDPDSESYMDPEEVSQLDDIGIDVPYP